MIVRVPSRPHESDYPWFRVFAPYNSESEFKPEEPAQCVERSQCDVICGGEIEWEKEKQKKNYEHICHHHHHTENHIHRERTREWKKCEHHRRFHDSQTHDFHSQFHNFFATELFYVLCFCFNSLFFSAAALYAVVLLCDVRWVQFYAMHHHNMSAQFLRTNGLSASGDRQ